MCYNIFVRSARFTPALPAMLARRAVLLTLSGNGNRPFWSYPRTGTLPRLISFVCRSYENTWGVGVFPFWYNQSAVNGNSPILARRFARPLFSYAYNSQISQLPSFDIHTECPGVYPPLPVPLSL